MMKHKLLTITSALAIAAPLTLATPAHADDLSPGAAGEVLSSMAAPPTYAYLPEYAYSPPPPPTYQLYCWNQPVPMHDHDGRFAGFKYRKVCQ
jgi:hypothetical protein